MDEMPPGFRFYPTEEELVSFYLHNKLQGRRKEDLDLVVPMVYIYEFNPWDLPKFAGKFCEGDPEQWFFFNPRQEKETRGGRPNRLTTCGYWKATGSPGYIYSSSNRIIGMKRTMVFYKGRAPNGRKTEWKMNEYTAIQGEASSSSSTTSITPQLRQEMSLCRVYLKSKCLRAFDRRPPAVFVAGEGEVLTDQQGDENGGQNQLQPLMEKSTSSLDNSTSSSTGGSDHINHSNSHSHMPTNYNYEPLWDWEQLNWV